MKFLLPLILLFATNLWANEEMEEMREDLDDLQEMVRGMARNTAGNRLNLGVDFRSAYDSIGYKFGNGGEVKQPGMLSNRLWINMGWKYNNNLVFKGTLAYHNIFGQNLSSKVG